MPLLVPAGTKEDDRKNTIVYTALKWYKAKETPRQRGLAERRVPLPVSRDADRSERTVTISLAHGA